MNFLTQYKGLPKQIYILSISRAVISMGMMFVYPFLSLLLTSRLGYTEIEASYIVVVASIASTLGTLVGGKLSDEIGRKKVYIAATFVVIITMAVAGFFASTHLVIFFIIITYFVASAILPTVSAMIFDWANESNKTECFSLMYLSGNIGSALGPVIAGMLFYSHMPWIFFSMSLIFLITFILVLCSVQDVYIPHKKTKHLEKVKQDSQLSIVLRNPVLLVFTICLAVLTLCYINLDFMLPLQLRDLFGLNAGSKYSSLVWTINGGVVVVCTPIIVSFTKKKHPLFNIGFACLLYAAGFSLYGFSSSILIYMMAVVIWTSGEILISTCAGIYIADQSPETHKGRSMSLYEFSRGLGRLTGPVFTGWLLQSHTYTQTWFMIAAICLAVDAVIWFLYRKRNS
ncbi:MFS transporter [Emergencia sp.]|uniref:MFS transporter n=1 Tax=Emergencia sp. TaxID=1926557 RepID=UPI003AEFF405